MFEGVKFIEAAEAPSAAMLVGSVGPCKVATSTIKRLFDIIFSLSALVFLLPFFVAVAILIKVDSKGPVLFLQKRSGLNGKLFNIYKFRSMTVAENGDRVIQAKADDKRVTRVGKILRRTSLDEVPQLINIFLGDMSFVGPRPHALAHDKEFAVALPVYPRRFRARPGLTGLAQVRGYRGEIHTAEDLENRLEADLEYIETWSFIVDVKTLAKTVPLMFGDKNAY
ncbi:MAG: sugar transferase [Asticcacaulis sp.]